ncbi:MAG: universal stress protein [Acidobacteria bacterium]|nr:universal stress protein [Acidobacteriota bacterium]
MAETTKILLAIDGSVHSDAAVDALIDRFRPERAEVRVLHAVEWLKELPASFRFGEGPTYANDILASKNKSFDEAARLIERTAERLRTAGFQTTTAMPDDDARHAILEEAEKWTADLIVIGSHGRRGLDRLLLGSVAESVVRHARCSVEIVRVRQTASR